MKNYLLFFFSFLMVAVNAQEKTAPLDAIRNDSLIITTSRGISNCKFIEEPMYIKNKNYVVYQDCNLRKILKVDMPTFKVVRGFNYSEIALDKNGVYLHGKFIAANTEGFAFLGGNEKNVMWKTNTTVYKNDKPLPKINAGEFEKVLNKSKTEVNPYYFRDRNHVYYFDQKIEVADVETVDLTEYDYDRIYDKNHIYKDGKIVYHEGKQLMYVNKSLTKTVEKVFFNGRVMPDIDAKTLVGLSRNYAKDKNQVYADSHADGIVTLPINKADFDKIKIWDHTNSAYISDGKNLFSYDKIFSESTFDVSTFGTFGYTDFVYDKNGVYARRYDPDLNKVVFDKFPFNYTEEVSSKNLQITRGSDSYVYYLNQAYEYHTKTFYENLTPEQIALTQKSGNLRLAKNNGLPLLATHLDYQFYKTDNGVYVKDELTVADPATFTPINHYFYKDKDAVYFYDTQKGLQKITYIDEQSAVPFLGFIADKDYIYAGGTRIIKSEDIEFIASFPGYRAGCGLDRTPGSDYYLMRNVDGFWWIRFSNDITVRFLGKKLDERLSPLFKDLELWDGV